MRIEGRGDLGDCDRGIVYSWIERSEDIEFSNSLAPVTRLPLACSCLKENAMDLA